MNYRSVLLAIIGIFILFVVAANLMYLPSIVTPVTNLSRGNVMDDLHDFAQSNNELSYTDRSARTHALRGKEFYSTNKSPVLSNVKTLDGDGDAGPQANDRPSEKETIVEKTSSAAVANTKLDEYVEKKPKNDDKPGESAIVIPVEKTTVEKKSLIAGLNCDKYGGPDESVASEMVYWRDIPSDSHFVSPYDKYGESSKYLTFEPDEGGWNNIRMSMETATALAHAMGRILVLPPEQKIYLLGNDGKKKNNRFTFHKFFPFDAISGEHKAVEVITMEEFLEREVMTGNIQKDGKPQFPPNNRTNWDGHVRDGREFWHWLRSVTLASTWDFSSCSVVFPKQPGKEPVDEMQKLYETMNMKDQSHGIFKRYVNNPTPVDGPATDRLREMLSFRKNICLYNDSMQKSKVMHFMGDNQSGARLLVHFYAFLFFEDWKQDLWTKRYVRDHLRYIDEIQCAAAKIVDAVRQRAKENGDKDGIYDSMHVRRGDFQYKQTRIPAQEIYDNIRDIFVENSTVFIATDERDKTFFKPLQEHYQILFLDDFLHLVPNLNKNYYGMLDQRIASRGRTFAGAYFSTFTGYINRMRGYHSQKDKLPGHEMGKLNSYFYVERQHKEEMRNYNSLKGPLWGREFPVAWRNIDHNLDESHIHSR